MTNEFKIWFAEGPTVRKHFWKYPLGWRVRLVLHHTSLVCYLFGSALIKWITGSHFSHVLIEHDGIVLDPMFTKNKYWETGRFQKIYPGRRFYFKFHTDKSIKLSTWETDKEWGMFRATIWGTVFRFVLFLTRGRVRLAHDCVSVACETLSTIGIIVPRHIVTPIKLAGWLKEEGYASTSYTSTHHR